VFAPVSGEQNFEPTYYMVGWISIRQRFRRISSTAML